MSGRAKQRLHKAFNEMEAEQKEAADRAQAIGMKDSERDGEELELTEREVK